MATPIIPTMTGTTPATYHVQSFNGRERLTAIHWGLSDFLNYQTNVWLECANLLPPHVAPANQAACDEIVRCLKEESRHLQTIHQLIDLVERVNNNLQVYYKGHERENSWGDNWQ